MSSISRAIELATTTGLNVVTFDGEAFVLDEKMDHWQCLNLIHHLQSYEDVRDTYMSTLYTALKNNLPKCKDYEAESPNVFDSFSDQLVYEYNNLVSYLGNKHLTI